MLEEEEDESETTDGVDGTSQNEGVQGKIFWKTKKLIKMHILFEITLPQLLFSA